MSERFARWCEERAAVFEAAGPGTVSTSHVAEELRNIAKAIRSETAPWVVGGGGSPSARALQAAASFPLYDGTDRTHRLAALLDAFGAEAVASMRAVPPEASDAD